MNQNYSHYNLLQADLSRVNPAATDSLLGLFAHDHMSYRLDATKTEEPSLIEMSQKALSILKKNPNGFLLMIEGKVKIST